MGTHHHHVVGTLYVLVCVQHACFSISASSKAKATVIFVSDYYLSNDGKEVLQEMRMRHCVRASP